MISLKHYLDRSDEEMAPLPAVSPLCTGILEAYLATLTQMSQSGGNVCRAREQELKQGILRFSEMLRHAPTQNSVVAAEIGIREVLQTWARDVESFYDEKASDVRDMLLVISKTVESLGRKDDRIAHSIDVVTKQLTSIASLDDVSRMRTSLEASARELKGSVERITEEGRALIDHLRAEVSTYQTKLESAERVSSRDSLTGVGSRHWVEGRIQDRIDAGAQFSVVLLDIEGFHKLVESHGNLVGDLLLKEFARELRSACRFTDVVGRWGNDEFMLLLDDAGDEIRPKVERLRAAICRKYHVPGRSGYINVPLVASIGVAEYRDEDDVQAVLERADLDMCRDRARALEKSA